MLYPILIAGAVSFAISWLCTLVMRSVAARIGFFDKPGQRKIHQKPIPLGGGVAIVAGFVLPLLAVIAYVWLPPQISHIESQAPQHALAGGVRLQTAMALGLVIAIVAMHTLGIVDDRRAMGPFVKLFIQLGIIAAFVTAFDVRALTFLDQLGAGRVPSIVMTVLWIGAITNAFNFLDNMDGLSAGVAAVCTTAFLVTALSIGQWFVAASLALLLGALLGFLCFNFPPASIFMGDSGSLVIGLLLGVLTVRTTFLHPGEDFGAGWYAVFAPLIVLAIPLYDLIVVSIIRLSRGRSLFVGDTNHFSHRLVARGMSRRTAVLCIYLVTAATAMAAIILPHTRSPFVAVLVFCQTLLILGVVALLEQHPLPRPAPAAEPTPPTPAVAVDRALPAARDLAAQP